MLAQHGFDTTRKAQWIADSLKDRPISGVELASPASLDRSEIEEVHGSDYVEAIANGYPVTLAISQGFRWDPGMWDMVRASNGGVRDAAFQALKDGVSGSLSSGLHHAKRDYGEGFCTFNGLVIAARQVLAQGVQKVLILDLDAHHGGGTHELVKWNDSIQHFDLSVSSYDSFNQADNEVTLEVSKPEKYLPLLKDGLGYIERNYQFDLCIYNAGVDCHERCRIGGLEGIDDELIEKRESMVFEWCRAQGLPVAFVLAGGYSGDGLPPADLVDLHRITIETAATTKW